MKAFRFASLAAAALFVAACLPVTSKNPIGSTSGFKTDPALVGLWVGHGDDGKPGYFAFLNNDDGSMTALLITPAKGSGDWGSYTLKTATLGPHHIMNVWATLKNGKPVDKDEADADIPILYRIGADGRLALYLLDDKATADAIRAGKIRGVVDPGSMDNARITAEPAALDAFFASKGSEALFPKPLIVLSRVK